MTRMLTPDRVPWMDAAACRGLNPELFFPGKGDRGHEARRVCAECPVRVPCAEYALTAPFAAQGIWGGTDEVERSQLRPPSDGTRVRWHSDRCGTPAGAKRHYRRGEKPCAPCLEAQRINHRHATAQRAARG